MVGNCVYNRKLYDAQCRGINPILDGLSFASLLYSFFIEPSTCTVGWYGVFPRSAILARKFRLQISIESRIDASVCISSVKKFFSTIVLGVQNDTLVDYIPKSPSMNLESASLLVLVFIDRWGCDGSVDARGKRASPSARRPASMRFVRKCRSDFRNFSNKVSQIDGFRPTR